MGEWEYPLIYGFKEDEWVALLDRWKVRNSEPLIQSH
jgi:hypothetical protein